MAGTLTRDAVATRDRDLAVETFTRLIDHTPRVRIDSPAAVDLRAASASFDDWGVHRVTLLGVRYEAAVEPMTFLVGGFLASGNGTVAVPGDEVRLTPGDCFLYPLSTAYAVAYAGGAHPWVRIAPEYVAEVAEESTGLPGSELRFLSVTPASAPLNRLYAETVRFVEGQLHHPELDVPPLLAAHLQRLAAGALLETFPNTAMTAARLPAPGTAAPSVIRRAVAFMAANAHRPLSVSEIAAAAGVGARGLQAAFRRHRDTTPLAHLRRIRLEHARRDLRAAVPGDGSTVTAIARRWGFGGRGRFTALYRGAFGESPGRTLRSR